MWVILFIINAIIVALIAKWKKRSALLWFIFGMLLPIITLIIVLFVRPIGKKCPACKEWIQKDAIKCKHCGTEIK